MPKHFKTLFKTNKIHAHIRKKPEGVYEIRCQINYHCIQASSKNLATAKEKFIEKLHSVDLSIKPEKARKEYFVNYMKEWLATSKKPFVKEATYKDYVHTFSVYIAPHFKGKKLTEIKHFELQSFLTTFSDSGRNRTAQKIYQLLSAVFEYAVTDELITVSPMKKVKLTHYEQEHGIPFKRRPTVISVVLAHRNKRQKKVVDSTIFLTCNCRLRRARRYPTLSPKEIAFFKVFHYLVHKLLSLWR